MRKCTSRSVCAFAYRSLLPTAAYH